MWRYKLLPSESLSFWLVFWLTIHHSLFFTCSNIVVALVKDYIEHVSFAMLVSACTNTCTPLITMHPLNPNARHLTVSVHDSPNGNDGDLKNNRIHDNIVEFRLGKQAMWDLSMRELRLVSVPSHGTWWLAVIMSTFDSVRTQGKTLFSSCTDAGCAAVIG